MKTFASLAVFLFFSAAVSGQYSHQDTLRGSITPERAWWDVLKYELTVKPDYSAKRITGSNRIVFSITDARSQAAMQIDLQEPMQIDSIFLGKERMPVSFVRNGNTFLLNINTARRENATDSLDIYFSGKPRQAVNPPWDGGWIWKKDAQGRPWMSVACQGLGASVWYPCKDHQSDEPDKGASLSMIVADSLAAVGNGRLREKKTNGDGTSTWTWVVTNPINNYNLIPYIGSYVNWTEQFAGEKGNLDCSYWVLDYNLEKSKQQFGRDVKLMLKCFESWFGPYPFYEDSYKLVESPHLGMEHQSAVAYGNQYKNGYLGMDISGSGWGRGWDYIIVHESGHEWFANSITTRDIADMWVHEGFTNYSEVLFVECQYGEKAADEYCQGLKRGIQNNKPIIGPYGVNKEGSGDMYAKGACMIHTIRQVINDDALFKKILKGLNRDFYHKTIDSKDVEEYITRQSGKDLGPVFDQYLRDTRVPAFVYRIEGDKLSYRWAECIKDFKMPLRVFNNGKEIWLQPEQQWQSIKIKGLTDAGFSVDKNFYVHTSRTDYSSGEVKP